MLCEVITIRVERRLPQLFRVHLSQALEALDRDGVHANAVVARAVDDRFELLVVITSYSIHYTKLYDTRRRGRSAARMAAIVDESEDYR